MANWLERAKREIPQGADRVTAIADERNPTAVMAVPEAGESEILRASIGSNGSARETVPMLAEEETVIRAWLAHIEETDPAIIAEVLNQCRTDVDARVYFMRRATEEPHFEQGVKHAKR